MSVVMELDAGEALKRLFQGLESLETETANAARLALNRTLDWAYTRAVRKLAKDTGIQQARVRLIVKKRPAQPGTLIAKITARSGFTSLKDFKPRQTKTGVVASPWGKRRVFPHTFIGPGGHVYKHDPKAGNPRAIRKLWGPAIPKEMLRAENMQPLLDEAMSAVFARNYEFFMDRGIEKTKQKFGL